MDPDTWRASRRARTQLGQKGGPEERAQMGTMGKSYKLKVLPRMKGRGGQEFRQHWGRTGKYRAKSQERTEPSWTSLSLSNA